MTTQGQGRATDPVGLGIPVVIDGPWAEPRIYPDMAGILDNPDAAYAKLKEMGKGLFGPNGALGGLGGNLLGGKRGQAEIHRERTRERQRADANAPGGNPLGALLGGTGSSDSNGTSDPLAGNLGAALGNLIQQGLSQSRQGRSSRHRPGPKPRPFDAGRDPIGTERPDTPGAGRFHATAGAGQSANERRAAAAVQSG